MLIIFLIFTVIFMIATACFGKLFHFAIQPGQVLDKLFNYQDMLERLFRSGKTYKQYLGKALGDCSMCFTSWGAFLSFWVYLFFCLKGLRFWITDILEYESGWRGDISFWGINVIWYIIYVSITAILSNTFISEKG